MRVFPHVQCFEHNVLFPLATCSVELSDPFVSTFPVILAQSFVFITLLAGDVSTDNGSSAATFSSFMMLIPVPGTVFDFGTDTVEGLATGCDCIDWYEVVGLVGPPAATGTITTSGVAILGLSIPNRS